jgi:integrase
MARRASVRYWPSRNAYCCHIKGQQHVLAEGPDDWPDGPTYSAACKRFGELVCLSTADMAKDQNSVRVVCELFLQHISTRRSAGTLWMRQKYLAAFTDALGDVRIRDLTRFAVDAWIDQMRQWRTHPHTGKQTRWANGSIRNALSSIQAAFNWASKSGLITKNPLGALPTPTARSRGREALTGRTPAERAANHQKILAAAPKSLRPLLVCLEATGCRPGELMNATAADFDADLGAIVYYANDTRLEGEFAHKTARHGKDRIIFLTGEALEIVRGLVEKYPAGPLFRTRKGTAWKGTKVGNRFDLIRKAIGIQKLTPYSYRHTFATAWLEQGESVDILAELLGNSPDIIRKHYSHLLGDTGNLRRQLEAFRGITPSAEGTGTPPTAANGDGVSPAE